MEFEIWIYRIMLSVLGVILWYVLRQWYKKVDTKFDRLIRVVEKIGINNERQNGDIRILSMRQQEHQTRLNNHSERIRKVELKTKQQDEQ